MTTISMLGRKVAKAAVLPLGLLPASRPADLVMLLYHRVRTAGREIDIPPSLFERHLHHLAAGGRVVGLDEALQPGRGGVVITIDDGFRDFHEIVLPLLVRFRLPALLYVVTGWVDGEGEAGVEPADRLTWSQLEEAVSTGLVTVGAHTHSHVNLAQAAESTAAEEMRRCRDLIEDRLGTRCVHFAYPWSVASPHAERLAGELFETAALGWRTNRQGTIQRHRLGRTPILRSDGEIFFRAKVSGRLDREALVYRALGRGPWRSF